ASCLGVWQGRQHPYPPAQAVFQYGISHRGLDRSIDLILPFCPSWLHQGCHLAWVRVNERLHQIWVTQGSFQLSREIRLEIQLLPSSPNLHHKLSQEILLSALLLTQEQIQ